MKCPHCKRDGKDMMDMCKEAARGGCGPFPPKLPKQVLYMCKNCKVLFDGNGKTYPLGKR